MQHDGRDDRVGRDATERELRGLLAQGDAAALEVLWHDHAEPLYAYLLAMLRSRHDAQDALQDTFVQVARKPKRVALARNLRAYLYRMARNAAVDQMRKRTRHAALAQSLGDDWLAPTERPGTDRGRGEALVAAMARLPTEQRVVLTLKVYQEMTFEEIAEAMDISPHTAASRYRYGLKKLKHLMRSGPT